MGRMFDTSDLDHAEANGTRRIKLEFQQRQMNVVLFDKSQPHLLKRQVASKRE